MDDAVNAASAVGGATVGIKAAAGKGTLIAMTGAGTVASIFAMLVFEPKTRKEMALCLVSTLVCASLLPSVIKLYFGFDLPNSVDGDLALAALIIACGSPGYLIAGAALLTAKKFKGKDIGQIITMIKGWFK